MRYISVIVLILLLTSCFNRPIEFEKDYYERITQIKFPDQYKVLETFDNGEFLTGTVFEIDSLTLLKLISENHFDTITSSLDTHMLSATYLVNNKPVFNLARNIFVLRKDENKINWTYIADLNSNRLWAEISYPDWGGQ